MRSEPFSPLSCKALSSYAIVVALCPLSTAASTPPFVCNDGCFVNSACTSTRHVSIVLRPTCKCSGNCSQLIPEVMSLSRKQRKDSRPNKTKQLAPSSLPQATATMKHHRSRKTIEDSFQCRKCQTRGSLKGPFFKSTFNIPTKKGDSILRRLCFLFDAQPCHFLLLTTPPHCSKLLGKARCLDVSALAGCIKKSQLMIFSNNISSSPLTIPFSLTQQYPSQCLPPLHQSPLILRTFWPLHRPAPLLHPGNPPFKNCSLPFSLPPVQYPCPLTFAYISFDNPSQQNTGEAMSKSKISETFVADPIPI